ncbi:unnamed protein product [Rhizophagus irregularis]|nr:unnamed protein product [Rhizophagus irregularis]
MKLLQTIILMKMIKIKIQNNEVEIQINSENIATAAFEVSRLLLDEIMMLSRPDLSSPMMLRIDSKIPKTNVQV